MAEDDGGAHISNAVGTLSLASSFIRTEPLLQELLSGKPIRRDQIASEPLRNVAVALAHQGCLSFDATEEVTEKELASRFEAIAHRWHAAYYSHQLWDALRSGQAPVHQLLAWMVHNYHVSRSAGSTDARSAATLREPHLKVAFAEGAISEYAHCDDFFLVTHPNLQPLVGTAKAALQSPGSLAFDQNMLRLAERDWRGHALVSFFQESSIQFYDEIVQFYRDLEATYDLPGAFDSWIAHMKLDQDECHAEQLKQALSGDAFLAAKHVSESVYGSALTFFYLLTALDDVCEYDGTRSLAGIRAGRVDGTSSQAVHRAFSKASLGIEADDVSSIVGQLLSLDPRYPLAGAAWSSEDRVFLRSSAAQAAFAALSRSKHHAEVMPVGRLAEHYLEDFRGIEHGLSYFGQRPNPWLVAVANFLYESSSSPLLYLASHQYLAERVGCTALGLDSATLATVQKRSDDLRIGDHERDELLNHLVQLEGLLGRLARDGEASLERSRSLLD